jgi:hypothetical protein
MIITDVWRAMKLGEEIGNPRKWKRSQQTATALSVLIGIGLKYAMPDTVIAPDMLEMAGNLVLFGAILLNYFGNIITTRKLGIPEK